MIHRFGTPPPVIPQTIVGDAKSEPCVLSLVTRIKVVVRVPAEQAKPGGEIAPDFEPKVRQAVADAMLGAESDGFVVVSCAVQQFEDAGG